MTASNRMMPKHLEHDWYSRPLPANVRLGARTWLYSSYTFAHYRSQAPVGLCVGHDTGLYHGTFFDLGPDAQIEIGDYCSLVGAIFATNGKVIIGDYTLIAHEVVIADSEWSLPGGDTAVRASAVQAAMKCCVEIGRNVWIGAQAVITGNVRIGEGAIIGAGTLVTYDVPPYTLCAGNPMRILRTLPNSQKPRSSRLEV